MKASLRMPANLQKMLEDLNELERSQIDDIAGDMLDAGAEVALAGMQRRVRVRTSKLKDHLKRSEIKRDGNVSFVEIGLINAPAEVVRYGTVNEFGSSSVKAQSYVRATMNEDKGKIYRAMKARLKAGGIE